MYKNLSPRSRTVKKSNGKHWETTRQKYKENINAKETDESVCERNVVYALLLIITVFSLRSSYVQNRWRQRHMQETLGYKKLYGPQKRYKVQKDA
jgi:hypothetical protein